MVCPDIPEGEELIFKGGLGNMVTKNLRLTVQKCSNSTRLPGEERCHSVEAIDEYISDVQVDAWVIQEMVDFKKYHTKPVFRTMTS